MFRYSSASLSVIVCAYNEAKTISNKIRDIVTKDKNNQILEIIIVDDNSSDETFKIAQDYLKENSNLKVFKNQHKKGKCGAIVTGFRNAIGKIICITDADVIFEENTIEKALALFNNLTIGAVSSNQKVSIIKDKQEGAPLLTFYEQFRNFFRILETKIDSTIAFHGQCMFFRKDAIELAENDSMADDIDIAIRIRKNGYKTVFCDNSYYTEKMPFLFNKISRHIFRRRAKAVAQVIIKNKNLLFNFRYKKFGLICFPLEFFLNIIMPFFVILTLEIIALGILLSSIAYNKFLFIIFIFIIFINYRLLLMAWYQASSVIDYLIKPENISLRWANFRY